MTELLLYHGCSFIWLLNLWQMQQVKVSLSWIEDSFKRLCKCTTKPWLPLPLSFFWTSLASAELSIPKWFDSRTFHFQQQRQSIGLFPVATTSVFEWSIQFVSSSGFALEESTSIHTNEAQINTHTPHHLIESPHHPREALLECWWTF